MTRSRVYETRKTKNTTRKNAKAARPATGVGAGDKNQTVAISVDVYGSRAGIGLKNPRITQQQGNIRFCWGKQKRSHSG